MIDIEDVPPRNLLRNYTLAAAVSMILWVVFLFIGIAIFSVGYLLVESII